MQESDKWTILLVDDDADLRKAIEAHMVAKGHKVLSATSGKQALDVLRARQESLGKLYLDVVVSDWMMPSGDGLELLQKIRALKFTVPFLLMSGAVTQAELIGALSHGPNGVLLKPFTKDMLIKKITEVLSKRPTKK